jgi:uncharacterized protein (DUF2225 family)
MKIDNKQEKIYIECDCGSHILQVTSDIDYHDDHTRFCQSFWLAMFSYGNGNTNENRTFWERLKIAWKYLRTGKMYEDAIIMSPEEAKKLIEFINDKML